MDVPITFHEQLQLTGVGIRQPMISFNNITMESDKFVVCREKVDDFPQIVIIDMADPTHQNRLPINADSVIMHPRQKIIAVRFGRTLQIFDIDKKAKVKEHRKEEDVVFWKWIDEETIGVVTETAVFHWKLAGESAPEKQFDRHPTMSGCQIINYRADYQRQWLILIGISVKGNRVAGSMQLYNTERRLSQPIEGHAAAFIKFRLDGNPHPSNLLVFSLKNDQVGKLQIVELGPPPAGNQPYSKKFVDVPYSSELAADFPIAMQTSSKHGVLFLVTKQGFVHIFDVDSGNILYSNRISAESIFITAEFSQGGFIGINRKGQVLSVSLNEQKMVEYVRQTLPDLARKLAHRWQSPFTLSADTSILDLDEEERAVNVEDFHSLSIAPPSPPPPMLSPPSSLLSIGLRYSPALDTPHSEVVNSYSNDRAETAERERDEIAVRFKELFALHTDLSARVVKAEKERDEFASRYLNLERKCREAMKILGGEEKDVAVHHDGNSSHFETVEPVNWHVNNGKQPNYLNGGSNSDIISQGTPDYSSLFDD